MSEIFTLEALRARHGDCLILHYGSGDAADRVLIDGGPSRVWSEFLEPRLAALRDEDALAPDDPLRFRMLMVSHIDADHIAGVIDLLRSMQRASQRDQPIPFRFRTLWHNSFDDALGGEQAADQAVQETSLAVGATAGLDAETLPRDLPVDEHSAFALASVRQGREVRLLADELGIPPNQVSGEDPALLLAGHRADLGGGLSFELLGPNQQQVDDLRASWKSFLDEQERRRREEAAGGTVEEEAVELVEFVDRSVPNLASLVVWAEKDGRVMLLTGDARGDFVLEALSASGRLPESGAVEIDLLKMPHHGSVRNVDDVFFERIRARHYVFSGDGRHGNPEPETFRLLLANRQPAHGHFVLHLTYAPEEMIHHYPVDKLERVFAAARERGLDFDVVWPAKDERSLRVELASATEPRAPQERVQTVGTAGQRRATASMLAGRVPSVDYVQQLIFGDERFRRYTQDSPVLPDVWRAYCKEPGGRRKLLLTPHFAATAGELTVHLRDDYQQRKRHLPAGVRSPRMAYNQLTVAIEASFDELVFLVLPRTTWWQHVVQERMMRYWQTAEDADAFGELLREFHRGRRVPEDRDEATSLWMAGLIGAILWAREAGRDVEQGIETLVAAWMRVHPDEPAPTVPPLSAYRGVAGVLKAAARHWAGAKHRPDDQTVWLVNLDRKVETAQLDSVRAIKADAARRLFEVDCSAIRWAVIDSGIDASHPAFQPPPDPGDQNSTSTRKRKAKRESPWHETTRVRASYDFSRVRYLLDLDWVDQVVKETGLTEAGGLAAHLASAIQADPSLRRDLEDLRLHLRKGRQIDWGMLEAFLRIAHDDDHYKVPSSGHGTHVAGILGGCDVPGDDGGNSGVCPDIGLYDLRVIDAAGEGDEFYVISALQFVRHLNSHQDYQVVHGANLSLSIRHEVRSYACGATPVCEEAERLMSSGVVVVVAAGNRGYQVFELADNRHLEGFLAISITDPGNAEKVITVGATHRSNPHTYGISYFSSRGPTGDGRSKPDLVAPGEKILAPVPGGKWEIKDGTSMAAPHVSGAAAMVLARHTELQGKSARVKEILCAAATDLGRERYFQGHGLVDVLRALQSV